MIIINIGISTDKKAVSRLSITLDDSGADEINVESVIAEIHAKMWRYMQTWNHQNIAITFKSEIVE